MASHSRWGPTLSKLDLDETSQNYERTHSVCARLPVHYPEAFVDELAVKRANQTAWETFKRAANPGV